MKKILGILGLLVALTVGFNNLAISADEEAAGGSGCGGSCECTSCVDCSCDKNADCGHPGCNCSEATCCKGACDTDGAPEADAEAEAEADAADADGEEG